MATKVKLNTEDRDFFSRVGVAIFTNPFSDENEQFSGLLSDDQVGESTTRGQFLWSLKPTLDHRIGTLDERDCSRLQQFDKESRPLIEYGYLLQIYLRFVPNINEVIEDQLTVGSTPIKVPFANQMMTELKRRGFSQRDAEHYLALYYQLRRAYYFIHQSLVGDSPSMKDLRRALWNNVFAYDIRVYNRYLLGRMEDFSTLLLGETGTGKGSAAAAIGRSGYIPFDKDRGCFKESFADTFVAANLSQIPETLIESELFGHRKGAFTGAVDNHKGLFARCSAYGALFLDEIGDVNVSIQLKLLQVLQERTFTPVGSHTDQRFSGRVIAATNHPLVKLRKQGDFRDDFFYRLCSDEITVPTLRQRIEESPSELEQLVNLLVSRLAGEESPSLTDMVLETFKQDLPTGYAWPGNVRELEQAVRRILLTRHYAGDMVDDGLNQEEALLRKIQDGNLTVAQLTADYCSLLYRQFGTYGAVAQRTQLDSRTVKKYLQKNYDQNIS